MIQYTKLDPNNCEFIVIGPDADLPDGKRIFIEIDDHPIVVFRIGGELFAVSDACSHDDGPLGDGNLEGFELSCPRHGARFDVRNGKVLSLPAMENITAYPVRVVEQQIEIGVPSVS